MTLDKIKDIINAASLMTADGKINLIIIDKDSYKLLTEEFIEKFNSPYQPFSPIGKLNGFDGIPIIVDEEETYPSAKDFIENFKSSLYQPLTLKEKITPEHITHNIYRIKICCGWLYLLKIDDKFKQMEFVNENS